MLPQVIIDRSHVASRLLLREIFVDVVDSHCPLPDSRGHALDRAQPDVAGGEHSGAARLQQEGGALKRPVSGSRHPLY